jgi:hypothetical protein
VVRAVTRGEGLHRQRRGEGHAYARDASLQFEALRVGGVARAVASDPETLDQEAPTLHELRRIDGQRTSAAIAPAGVMPGVAFDMQIAGWDRRRGRLRVRRCSAEQQRERTSEGRGSERAAHRGLRVATRGPEPRTPSKPTPRCCWGPGRSRGCRARYRSAGRRSEPSAPRPRDRQEERERPLGRPVSPGARGEAGVSARRHRPEDYPLPAGCPPPPRARRVFPACRRRP